MSDRPTPETNANEALIHRFTGCHKHADSDHARNLERERDEALATLARLRQDLADPPADVQEAVLDKLNLRTVITERNDARELARELLDALENCREDSVELLGEWDWKRNTICKNNTAIAELEGRINAADAAIDKAKEVLP